MTLRIVQVCHDCVPTSGGTYTSAQDFRRALGADVVSFTAAALREQAPPDGGGVHHIFIDGGPLRRSYAWPGRGSPGLAAGEQRVARASMLIVHGLFRYHAQWARALAHRYRIPYWLVPHGTLDPWVFSYRALRKKAWLALVGRHIVADAQRVLHATPQEAAAAAAYIPSHVPASVIPWPVDPQPAEPGAGAAIRMRLGVAADADVLLVLGRLHPSKGILEAIRAVGDIAEARLHLLLVGPETRALSSAECRALGDRYAPGRVHLTGGVENRQIKGYLAASDALLSLSRRENFGYAVAEAMAAGLPVIITPQVALASSLQGIECGWIMSERSGRAAHAALTAFLATSPTERARLGANGRQFVERELSRERFARRLRELLPLGSTQPTGGRDVHA